MPFLAQWFVKCINLKLGNGWKEAEYGKMREEKRAEKKRDITCNNISTKKQKQTKIHIALCFL